MILSDKDIKRCLKEGTILIEPPPGDTQIDTTTVDLRIGEPIWEWNPDLVKKRGVDLSVDIDDFNYPQLSESFTRRIEKDKSGRYSIEPGHFT